MENILLPTRQVFAFQALMRLARYTVRLVQVGITGYKPTYGE
jgi:hypothetical protein